MGADQSHDVVPCASCNQWKKDQIVIKRRKVAKNVNAIDGKQGFDWTPLVLLSVCASCREKPLCTACGDSGGIEGKIYCDKHDPIKT